MESMLGRIRNPSCRKSHCTIVFCLFVCKPKIAKHWSLHEKAGMVHVNKGKEVDLETTMEVQKELNGNTSMLIKFFYLGTTWNQVERMRETILHDSLPALPHLQGPQELATM